MISIASYSVGLAFVRPPDVGPVEDLIFAVVLLYWLLLYFVL